MIGKILKPGQVSREALRDVHRHRIILATGCFDIIHVGHVKLMDAITERYRGLCLWVGINSDRAVRQLKGEDRPMHDFISRALVVAGLQCVDRVFEIDDVRVAEAIRVVQPIVWVKGGDYTLETLDKDEVSAANSVQADIVIIPRIGNYSTSNILKKLKTHERAD